jgi:hypothetical protein
MGRVLVGFLVPPFEMGDLKRKGMVQGTKTLGAVAQTFFHRHDDLLGTKQESLCSFYYGPGNSLNAVDFTEEGPRRYRINRP